jgi:hypothetical protein
VKHLYVLMTVALWAGPGSGESIDLFNGKDLRGWEGDPRIWKVVDGAIVGLVAEGTQVEDHTYLVWQGGRVSDFELSLKFRSDAGNSGIDYRAGELAKGKKGQDLRWSLRGYQADIVRDWMGSFYNWDRAGAQPGQFAIITTAPGGEDKQATKVFPLAPAQAVRGSPYYRPEQWNDYTITARGQHAVHRINGFQTVELIDVSRLQRSEGYLGLQVHAGTKRQLHLFKEIRLQPLRHHFGTPVLLCPAPNSGILEAVEPDSPRLADRSDLAFAAGTPGRSLMQTQERFSDVILRFQFPRGAQDLSVWLRAGGRGGLGVTGIGGRSVRIEPQGESGLKVVAVEKTDRAEMPPFETGWEDCEISLIGGELDVKINGRLTAKAVACAAADRTIALTSNAATTVRNVVLIPVRP